MRRSSSRSERPATLFIDIETYSGTDLGKSGVYRYSESPDFEVLLFGYSADGGEVRIVDLASGETLPPEIREALTDENVMKWAHNAQFERVCLSRWLQRNGVILDSWNKESRFLNPESWRCTMIWSAYLGLPLSLEGVARITGAEKQKLSEGKELIRYFSSPCKPTKANSGRTRNLPVHASDKLANVITTSSGDRKIPVVASKGTASWVDEEGSIPESDDSFSQVSIGAYKLATMIKVSEELLNDNVFNLESYITKEFARRIGNKEEDAFFTGDGVGKPLGILAGVGGAQLGVTTASATAITLDEVLDLFYSLKAPYRNKAVFVLNDSTIKAIRKLKDSSGQYLWQPSIKEATPDTILNRPLYTSAYIPAIEAGAKAIVFGDFGYYWVADRQGRVFKRLNELYAATGQVGFIATQRVDGKLILPEAVKVLQQKAA